MALCQPLACCRGKRRLWAFFTLVAGLGLCAAAVYLFICMHELVITLTCTLTKVSVLSRTAETLGATVVGQLPVGFIEGARQAVPYLDFAAIMPALVSTLFLLLAAGLGCGCAREQRSFCCAKCFVLLSELALTLTLAFYVVVVAIALLADRPVLTDQWDAFTNVCSESLPRMQQATTDAQGALESVVAQSGASPGQRATAQATLDASRAQLSEFEALCECLERVPSAMLALRGPGLAGLLVTLLAYVAVSSLCCAAGCCRRQPVRIVPDDPSKATEKLPPSTAQLEPEDDSELADD